MQKENTGRIQELVVGGGLSLFIGAISLKSGPQIDITNKTLQEQARKSPTCTPLYPSPPRPLKIFGMPLVFLCIGHTLSMV